MVEDGDLKQAVLDMIVGKYTPHLAGIEFPDNVMRTTGIIQVTMEEYTGKYYK